MKINYVKGDLFDLEFGLAPIYIAHCCNDKNGFGSGFVVPLAKKFPLSKTTYHAWSQGTETKHKKFEMGQTQFVYHANNVTICNMVAQILGGARPLRYDKLAQAMGQVRDYILDRAEPDSIIVAPLFGTGLAGGSLEVTLPLIQDIWINNGIPTTLYYLEDSPLTEDLMSRF